MNNQTQSKTPGAMVLVPREPTVEMYDAAMSAVSTPEEMPIVANAYNMNSACFRARYQAALSVVEQTPAVGGEPEVMAWWYRAPGSHDAVRSFKQLSVPSDWEERQLIDRAHVAPLRAEVQRLEQDLALLKDEDLKWAGLRDQEAEIAQLKARIAELEAEKARGVSR